MAILGADLDSLNKGHSILDDDSSNLITVYTKDAEVGFSENLPEPILLSKYLISLPSHWYGKIPSSADQEDVSPTSYSWLVKALAIRLAERGAKFLLHTRILEIDDEVKEVHFRGGGSEASGVHSYDQLYDFR